jgi:hypothetical protein
MIRIHFPPSVPGEDEIELVRAVRGTGEHRDDLWNRRFRMLFECAPQYFRETSLDEAEVVFYPHMYSESARTLGAANAARARKLPIVFMRTSDSSTPIKVPYGAIIYRHSIFRSQLQPCEEAMPAFSDDMLLERNGKLELREKRGAPHVGFRGYVSSFPKRVAYRLMGRIRKAEGLELRAKLLDRLVKTAGIECDLVPNDAFMGGREGISNPDQSVAAKVRQDFIQSILGSDYTLCVRGAGNFSYRFYEVLSAGRIPLYVDTDTVLPFSDEIDWKTHCVWVEEREMLRIGEKLRDFHNQISAAEFEDMQRKNRQLWEDYLTPLAFYRRALTHAIASAGPARVPNIAFPT